MRVFPEPIAYERYAAILSVGTNARPELAWTVINSNGWLARVSSGATSMSGTCSQRNPIAARVAANLGVAEVFKRIAGVMPERGPLLDGLRFSAFTYTCGSDDPGPSLPDNLELPTFLLGGCGAIGNGITELLAALDARGAGVTMDKQSFGDENLGTCVLMRFGFEERGDHLEGPTVQAGILGSQRDLRVRHACQEHRPRAREARRCHSRGAAELVGLKVQAHAPRSCLRAGLAGQGDGFMASDHLTPYQVTRRDVF